MFLAFRSQEGNSSPFPFDNGILLDHTGRTKQKQKPMSGPGAGSSGEVRLRGSFIPENPGNSFVFLIYFCSFAGFPLVYNQNA